VTAASGQETAAVRKPATTGVWADVDAVVERFKTTKAALKELGNENKCGIRPSALNAVHWVAKCRRQDCDDRELLGTAAELPAMMATHSAAHEKRRAAHKAKERAAKAAERKAAAEGAR
jgi:hypothetical protein